MPHAISLLLEVDIELNVVFNLIVLWIGAFLDGLISFASLTFLVVAQVTSSQDTRLLEDPACQLLAELEIGFILSHYLIAAHLYGAGYRSSVIVASLVASD